MLSQVYSLKLKFLSYVSNLNLDFEFEFYFTSFLISHSKENVTQPKIKKRKETELFKKTNIVLYTTNLVAFVSYS